MILRKNYYLFLQIWCEDITVSFYLLAQIFISDAQCTNPGSYLESLFEINGNVLGPENEIWPF